VAAGGPPGARATTPCSSFLLPLQLSEKIFLKNVAIKKHVAGGGKSCLPEGGAAVCTEHPWIHIYQEEEKRRKFSVRSIPGFIEVVANDKKVGQFAAGRRVLSVQRILGFQIVGI
jgi:hypothetical protein